MQAHWNVPVPEGPWDLRGKVFWSSESVDGVFIFMMPNVKKKIPSLNVCIEENGSYHRDDGAWRLLNCSFRHFRVVHQRECWVEFVIAFMSLTWQWSNNLINCPNCTNSLKIKKGEDLSAIDKGFHRIYGRQNVEEWNTQAEISVCKRMYFPTENASHQQNLMNTSRLKRVGPGVEGWPGEQTSLLWMILQGQLMGHMPLSYTWPVGGQNW